jgi:malonate-semialdehyde dehydrogenase (acetylating)/methylmalonate-semialdehyde dehydrogenase
MLIGQFIGGRMVLDAEQEKHPLINPATEEPIRQLIYASAEQVNAALVAAQAAFPDWSNTPVLKRARVLFRFKTLLETHADALAAVITEEHGKTLDDARGEIQRAIELVEYLCGAPALLKGDYSHQVAEGLDVLSFRQALGVSVCIAPFNFPVMIACWLAITAIVAGNTVVLKPSEKTPSAALQLAGFLQAAGLPDGVFNVIQGAAEQVHQLITDPRVAAVSCIGSTAVARHIYETAVAHGKRAQAFGGAKNHGIVLADANIDFVLDAVTGAAFGSTGQRCMALPVLIFAGVSDAQYQAFCQQLLERLASLRCGSGFDPENDMGPLSSQAQLDKVKNYLSLGIQEGAKLILDGRQSKVLRGYFIGPSVFDHVQSSMRIYQEEIFGPVLGLMRAPDLATAIALINQHAYGNGASLFTNHQPSQRYFIDSTQAGMLGINVPIPVPVAWHSFGGWKQSMFGDIRLHGAEGLRFFTKEKSVSQRSGMGALGAHLVMPAH